METARSFKSAADLRQRNRNAGYNALTLAYETGKLCGKLLEKNAVNGVVDWAIQGALFPGGGTRESPAVQGQ